MSTVSQIMRCKTDTTQTPSTIEHCSSKPFLPMPYTSLVPNRRDKKPETIRRAAERAERRRAENGWTIEKSLDMLRNNVPKPRPPRERSIRRKNHFDALFTSPSTSETPSHVLSDQNMHAPQQNITARDNIASAKPSDPGQSKIINDPTQVHDVKSSKTGLLSSKNKNPLDDLIQMDKERIAESASQMYKHGKTKRSSVRNRGARQEEDEDEDNHEVKRAKQVR